MEKLASGLRTILKPAFDEWQEVSVADDMVQISHSREIMIEIRARMG